MPVFKVFLLPVSVTPEALWPCAGEQRVKKRAQKWKTKGRSTCSSISESFKAERGRKRTALTTQKAVSIPFVHYIRSIRQTAALPDLFLLKRQHKFTSRCSFISFEVRRYQRQKSETVRVSCKGRHSAYPHRAVNLKEDFTSDMGHTGKYT